MSKEVERNPGPKWMEGVPFCAEENCPEYDGKRCRMMGFRPSQICEPAVRQMSVDLKSTTARAEKAEDALAKIASGMAWPINDDLPQRILEAVRLETADAVRWGARAQEAEELLCNREKDLELEHGRAEVFEKACDGIATALGWPVLPHPEDVDNLVEAVVLRVSYIEQLVSRLEQSGGKRNCDVCVWDGLDCNDRKPDGCKRWLCVPPGFVPQFKFDEALARVKQIGEERDESRRRAESCAMDRPWTGYLLMHIAEDEHEPAGVVVDFETSDGPSELWLPLADIPEDCRELGAKCRIEWSQERWTQVELDEARKRAEEFAPLFVGDDHGRNCVARETLCECAEEPNATIADDTSSNGGGR